MEIKIMITLLIILLTISLLVSIPLTAILLMAHFAASKDKFNDEGKL